MRTIKMNLEFNDETWEQNFEWLVNEVKNNSLKKITYVNSDLKAEFTTRKLFVSSLGTLAQVNRSASRWGQVCFLPKHFTITKAYYESTHDEVTVNHLEKFKKAFTRKVHPNLWADLQEGYGNLDIDDFIAWRDKNRPADGRYIWYVSEYSRAMGLRIITENCYKTTTIKSHNPNNCVGGDRDWNYYSCIENIKKHLDNQEGFYYSWTAGYDVSVEGRLHEDGIYRAYLNLEYKGCGNGHYYLLINENTAVFAEDD